MLYRIQNIFSLFAVILGLTLLVSGGAKAEKLPTLRLTDDGRSAGYATLAWAARPGVALRLEEKNGAGWEVIYQGPDQATTLSGLSNGEYLFRLSDGKGRHTEPFPIKIVHHSLMKAGSFFGIGAVVFLALIALLACGVRRVEQRT